MAIEVSLDEALRLVHVTDGSVSTTYTTDSDNVETIKSGLEAASDVESYIQTSVASGLLVEQVYDVTPTAPGKIDPADVGVTKPEGNSTWNQFE